MSISDGDDEEEGGDDAEMEAKEEEGDDTAEKVLQSVEVHSKMTWLKNQSIKVGCFFQDDDEEVGNLQLAWEMLELAKVIYKRCVCVRKLCCVMSSVTEVQRQHKLMYFSCFYRKETKDEQLMAAQAHLKLGEVSTETGTEWESTPSFNTRCNDSENIELYTE